jgi:hypothetical protein
MQRLLTGETRLPGFTAPWQVKRLGDHVSFLRNGVHSRAQLTVNDPVCYLHYGDIHASSSIRLDLSRAMMPRLPAATAARLTRLEDGDVVFVDASEDLLGVGKSLEIGRASGIEAVAGQHTIAARFAKEVLADGFKGYLCEPVRAVNVSMTSRAQPLHLERFAVIMVMGFKFGHASAGLAPNGNHNFASAHGMPNSLMRR